MSLRCRTLPDLWDHPFTARKELWLSLPILFIDHRKCFCCTTFFQCHRIPQANNSQTFEFKPGTRYHDFYHQTWVSWPCCRQSWFYISCRYLFARLIAHQRFWGVMGWERMASRLVVSQMTLRSHIWGCVFRLSLSTGASVANLCDWCKRTQAGKAYSAWRLAFLHQSSLK